MTPSQNSLNDLSGYDFGYFLKILTAMALPLHESDFHTLLGIWFPSILDMKYIHRAIDKTFKGGLKDVADQLQVCWSLLIPCCICLRSHRCLVWANNTKPGRIVCSLQGHSSVCAMRTFLKGLMKIHSSMILTDPLSPQIFCSLGWTVFCVVINAAPYFTEVTSMALVSPPPVDSVLVSAVHRRLQQCTRTRQLNMRLLASHQHYKITSMHLPCEYLLQVAELRLAYQQYI